MGTSALRITGAQRTRLCRLSATVTSQFIAADGTLIGVRMPLAEHEQPIVRTYPEIEDMERAAEEAKAVGALTAYPSTSQGDNTGT